jgi:hypothetical protein
VERTENLKKAPVSQNLNFRVFFWYQSVSKCAAVWGCLLLLAHNPCNVHIGWKRKSAVRGLEEFVPLMQGSLVFASHIVLLSSVHSFLLDGMV